jgi:hypothetical protein
MWVNHNIVIIPGHAFYLIDCDSCRRRVLACRAGRRRPLSSDLLTTLNAASTGVGVYGQFSLDANGTVNRRPKSDEEWATVRNSAIVLTEAANLLMMSPRAKDGDEWMKRSQEMMDTGLAAWKASPTPRTSISCSLSAATSTRPAQSAISSMDAIKNANK